MNHEKEITFDTTNIMQFKKKPDKYMNVWALNLNQLSVQCWSFEMT